MKFLSSISPLANDYDAFILDLWGVIHDGQQLYPNVKACLQNLRAQQKKIIFLSNAPRRAEVVEASLQRMGIEPALYDAVMTSGEAAYQCLKAGGTADFTPTGKNYLYIGLERDREILSDLNYKQVANPGEAQFVLLNHFHHDHQPMSEVTPVLAKCAELKLPMLCINPDLEVVRMNGEHVACAGVIAKEYERLGGKVIYFGKPHPAVYRTVLGLLGDSKRIVAVGDSLKTDIRGAEAMGIDAVLVTGGILAKELKDETQAEAKLKAICGNEGLMPHYAVAAFTWDKQA